MTRLGTGEGQQVLGRITRHRLELRELPSQHPGDDIHLFVDVGGVGLGEYGADGGTGHDRADGLA